MGDPVTNTLPLNRDGLLAGYESPSGVFDEMIAPTGSLRSPWEQFIGGVNRSGPHGLTQRADQVKRLLREGGVTYSAVGARRGRIGRGNSIRCRCCSISALGSHWLKHSFSGPHF